MEPGAKLSASALTVVENDCQLKSVEFHWAPQWDAEAAGTTHILEIVMKAV